jgi:hypothetical protein
MPRAYGDGHFRFKRENERLNSPRKGLSGADKAAEIAACRNIMAE